MLLPFFLSAHAYAHVIGAPLDGFSIPYQRSISIAALVYALLGLLTLRAVLRRLDVRDGVIAAVLLTLGFATQLVQYTSIQPGWTHVYSFCLFAVFMLLAQRIASDGKSRDIILLGAVLGLIVLIRPVNALVVLSIPVVLGDGTLVFVKRLFARPRVITISLLVCCAIISIQCALWYAQVGHLFAYGYAGEGFYWAHPQFFNVLFGIRRGLFIWTPVLILSVVGTVTLWNHDRVRCVALVVYFIANTYVISCWWIWYYGSGFGARVYIEHYPVLMVPIALLLSRSWGWKSRIVPACIVCCSAYLLAQFYQFNHRLLQVECMDRKKYAYSFLRFDDAHRDKLGGLFEVPPYGPNGMDVLLRERWNAESGAPHFHGHVVEATNAPSPMHVIASTPEEEFSIGFEMKADELPVDRALYLVVGFERHVLHVDDTRTLLGVASSDRDDGSNSFYLSFAMEPLPPAHDDVWEHIEYRIPYAPLHPGERIKFYFWNPHHDARFELDDIDITVHAVRPY